MLALAARRGSHFYAAELAAPLPKNTQNRLVDFSPTRLGCLVALTPLRAGGERRRPRLAPSSLARPLWLAHGRKECVAVCVQVEVQVDVGWAGRLGRGTYCSATGPAQRRQPSGCACE